jgi:hypothetical protein
MRTMCSCAVAKFISVFGVLQTVHDRKHPWAWSCQQAAPTSLAIFLTVAIMVGLVVPAPADERPGDPFGNHTAELKKDAPLVSTWESLRDKMQFEKAYFHECLSLKEPPCPSISTLVQKLDEIRQHRGKALLGHLNISVNLMITPAASEWIGPLEAITMRHGDFGGLSKSRMAHSGQFNQSAVAGLGKNRLRASRCLGLPGSPSLSLCFLG